MARSELVAVGAWMKNTVANLYTHNGTPSARGIARAYMASIVDAVSEIEGKDMAAGLLFDVTDAHLAGVLVADLPHIALARVASVQSMVQPDEGEQLWQWAKFWRCMGWWALGFLAHGPLVGLFHAIFG